MTKTLKSVAVSVGCLMFGVSSALGATTSRVFTTSTTYNGNLGGLSGADSKCQARADAASLGGVWKAWVSITGTGTAVRFTHATGLYRRLDEVIIALNWTDLTDGGLSAQPHRTELGTTLVTADRTWTGTDSSGSPTGSNCSNFLTSIGSPFQFEATGQPVVVTASWSNTAQRGCDEPLRLYCFEDPVELGPKSISGRIIQDATVQNRPITNAVVTLAGGSLSVPITFRTGKDGTYHFDNIESGLRYTVTVTQRRFTFSATRTVALVSNMTDISFIGAR
jgi:hypothetical protein